MQLEDVIEKHVLANALKFDGRANPKAVVGNVIADFKDAKSEMEATQAIIKNTAERINELSLEAQK